MKRFFTSLGAIALLSGVMSPAGIGHVDLKDGASAFGNPFQREAKANPTKVKANGSTDLKEIYADIAREAAKTATIALPAKTVSEGKELVMEEDFSLWTDGSEAELGAYVSTYLEDYDSSIDASLTHIPGWWGFGVMQAGGMAALAHPNFGGVLTTGPMNMYGNVTVSFRLKAREENPAGKKQSMIVCPIYGDTYSPVQVCDYQIINLTPEEGWQEYSLNFPVDIKSDDVRIQFNGTYTPAGFLLDDIKIERDYEFCLQPKDLTGYGFDMDGFTAAWTPGAENYSYLLTLLQEVEVGTKDVEGVIDFNDASPQTPDNVKLSLGDSAFVAEGTEGTQAFKLDKSGTLSLECGGGRIYGLSLFIKPFISELSEYTTNYPSIRVEGYDINGWVKFGNIELHRMAKDGVVIKLEDTRSFPYAYSKLRFSAADFLEGDYCAIDDISFKATPETETTTILDEAPVTEASYRVDGLNPEGEYYFAVEGVKREDMKSGRTAFHHALGLPTPVVTPPVNVEKRGAYSASWEATPKAAVYEIVNYEHSIIQKDEEDHVVISDNFKNALEENGYLNGTSFDGIADNNGWLCAGGLISLGAIGGFQKPLYTPELSLGNDNGRFTIRMKVKAFPDEIVVVQSNDQYIAVDLWELYSDRDIFEMVEHEMELSFDNGTEHERLIIYGGSYGTILLENFTVTQNVKAGDEIFKYADLKQVDANELSVRFSGLKNTPDFNYAYNVKAAGNFYGQSYFSDTSNDITVDFETSGIEEVLNNVSAARGIKVVNGGIEVTLPSAAQINVYSLDGTVAASVNGECGSNHITLNPGIYAVDNGQTTTKVIVK